MSDYGVKIAQPGYSITTSDPRNLVFSSAFRTLNVALTGTLQQTQNGGSYTFSVSHGLSFTPFALVFHKTSAYPNQWVVSPVNGLSTANLNGDQTEITSGDIRMSSTQLQVIARFANGSSETITLRYYIFNISV